MVYKSLISNHWTNTHSSKSSSWCSNGKSAGRHSARHLVISAFNQRDKKNSSICSSETPCALLQQILCASLALALHSLISHYLLLTSIRFMHLVTPHWVSSTIISGPLIQSISTETAKLYSPYQWAWSAMRIISVQHKAMKNVNCLLEIAVTNKPLGW